MTALVACDGRSPGDLSTGSDGLQTFSYEQSAGGAPILCTLEAAVNPVAGTLAGDRRDRERVWLLARDGQRISVAWPRGFTVRFEPHAVLYNEAGRAVARAGDEVELGQVNVGEHNGTPADPYRARGLVLGGCYPAGR